MSGAGFILAINMAVAGLFAASFAMIAAYDAARIAPRIMAASYVLGMAYFACEFAIPLIGPSRFSVPFAFLVFLAATMTFNLGLAQHYRVDRRLGLMAVLFALSAVDVYLIQDMPRQSVLRMMLYQSPYAAMQLIGLAIVWRSGARGVVDLALAALLGASALQFLGKPFLALASGGWGADPQLYIDSTYAMTSQAMGAVFGVALALMMVVVFVRDIVAAAAARSETDTLSGLLNRGGFDTRAELALRDAVRRGLPVSLVVADIDHFKSINDGYGHAVGDRVIAAFARHLQEAAADGAAVGRIGGEEFAILLPGANLPAARLFAEASRNAFSSHVVDGLPRERRCTASFGVAEGGPGESLRDLLARADAALYVAKEAGRDRVRTAWPPKVALLSRRTG